MDQRDVTAGMGHVDALLGAYSLGVLDDAGVDEVEQHIDVCARCRDELTAYQNTAADLSFTAPYVSPPPGLKDRVLARAAATGRADQRRETPLTLLPGSAVAVLAGQKSQRTARQIRPWQILAVAAVLAVALLGGDAVYLHQQVDHQQHVVAALQQSLQHQMADQQHLIAGLQSVLTGSGANAHDASATIHMLHGMGPAVNAVGTLVMSPQMPDAVLIVHNLPILQTGMAYDCWLIGSDGKRTFVGTVVVDKVGDGYMPVIAPHALGSYKTIGITSQSTSNMRVLEGAMNVPTS